MFVLTLQCLAGVIPAFVVIPALIVRRRRVEDPRMQVRGGSRLLGLAVRVPRPGHFPDTVLVLLAIRGVILVLVRFLHLNMRTRIIRQAVFFGLCWQLISELLEAPSENRKIRGFRAALDGNDQPASSYCLPVGGASVDIDDCISSPSSGMPSRKVSKLLPYPRVHSRRFYHFEG